MPEAVEWIIQGGALGLLGYLVIWATRTGAPNLFKALGGIKTAVDKNTERLGNLETTNRELTRVVGQLANQSATIGEQTLQFFKQGKSGSGG